MKGRFGYISETLLLFLIIDGLNLLFFAGDLGFLQAAYSPYWLPILITASRYGVGAALFSSAVATLHFLYFAFGALPSRVELQIEAELRGLDLPILFFLIGALLGAIRQRFIRKERAMDEELETKQELIELEREKYEASEEVRQAIEAKVVGQTVTIRTLYGLAMEFSEGEEKQIFKGCLDLLSDHFQVQRASVWLRIGDEFALSQSLGWSQKERVEGRRKASETILDFAFRRNQMTTMRHIQEWAERPRESEPIVALFPIRGGDGTPVGLLVIEEINLLSLTQSNLELIDLVAQWMSRSLAVQRRISKLERDVMWDSRFNVYSPHYFREALDREFVRSRDLEQDLTVAMLQVEHFGGLNEETRDLISQAVVGALKSKLDPSSMLCSYDLDGVFAVLSPSMEEKMLDRRLAQVQKELGELQVVRTLELEGEIAECNPFLSFGCVQRSEEMESCHDLERALLRACGLGALSRLLAKR